MSTMVRNGAPAPTAPPSWERSVVADEDGAALAVLTRTATGGPVTAALAAPRLRRLPGGTRAVSITFVLRRLPTPTERLGPLVERAVVALELDLVPPESALAALAALGGAGHEPARPVLSTASSFTLLRPDGTAAAASAVVQPFPRAGLEVTLEGDDAAGLLALVAGEPVDWVVTADVVVAAAAAAAAPSPGGGRVVRVHLGRLHGYLAARADDTSTFTQTDLRNYLPTLRSAGIVTVEGGDLPDDALLAPALRAARAVLRAVPDQGDGAETNYRLAGWAPGDQVGQERFTLEAAPERLVSSVGLDELLAPALAADLAAVVHVVGPAGDPIEPVLRAGRARGRGAPGADVPTTASLRVQRADRILAAAAVLDPGAALAPTHLLLQPQLAAHAGVLLLAALEVVTDGEDRRPGPLVADPAAAAWPDRFDPAVAWYATAFELERPDPAQPAADGPFLFDVEPSGGHTVDGTPGITATITVHLRKVRSAATDAAATAMGRTELRPVALGGLSAQLLVPFRDEHGETVVEPIAAEAVDDLGDRVRVRFRLLDTWARLAYGALSVPGFQARPAVVSVASAFDGWRRLRDRPVVAGMRKQQTVLTMPPTPDRADRADLVAPARRGAVDRAPMAAPLLATTTLATAAVHPAWQLDPQLVSVLGEVRHEWGRFASTALVEVLLPCATHGASYRERHDGAWTALGCRPAFQLGQAEHRTYEPIAVAAAGTAKVYRSLRSPGRFLVVPATYAIGRYEPGTDDAYRPTVLLHSTIDVDDPTNIRCILSASLQPDLPPFVRSRILAELRRGAHPAPVLELLPEAGVAPDVAWALPAGIEADCTASPSGFDLVLSTDVSGFLTLQGLLERNAIRGAVTATLPGGVRLEAALVLGAGAVTGPFRAGALELVRAGTSLTVTNRTGQAMALTGVEAAGVVVAAGAEVLPAGAATTRVVPAEAGALDAAYAPDAGQEHIDEVRAYVEDLQLSTVFVALADPAAAGLDRLEVRTRFGGHTDPEALHLTSSVRQQERWFVLPLTQFAADPSVDYRVTAVAVDGTRTDGPWTAWPVRTRGALVPISPPSPDPGTAPTP